MRTKAQNAARVRVYRNENPLKARDTFLRSKFGLSLHEYECILVKQEGKCAICGKGETVIYRGKVKQLAVDHCHASGAVRGLLCQSCNLILGHCDDNPALLRRAAAYLELYGHAGMASGKRAPTSQVVSSPKPTEIEL